MKHFVLLFIVSLLIACGTIGKAKYDENMVKKEVMAASAAWIEHFNKGDARYCSNAYTEDTIMDARPFGQFKGREAVYDFWKPFIASGAGELVYSDVKYEVVDATDCTRICKLANECWKRFYH